MKESDEKCKFYSKGKCLHEDAPLALPECIGIEQCAAHKDNISHLAGYSRCKEVES